MGKSKEQSTAVVEEAVEAKEEKSVETAPKFTVERLGQECRKLFDVSQCVYAGATYGLEGEYTVEEMRARIENWKQMEVK